jgi:cellobiose phosphorylase
MQMREGEVSFTPCLPSHWPEAELTLKREGRTLRVIFCNPDALIDLDPKLRASARSVASGESIAWHGVRPDGDDEQSVCILTLAAPSYSPTRAAPMGSLAAAP